MRSRQREERRCSGTGPQSEPAVAHLKAQNRELQGVTQFSLMGETTEAVTREFERMLERFQTVVPLPSEGKISVTSRDGRLQLTLNP